MPCNVKCRCGKSEKHFQFLNEGDISHFDCDECPPEQMENEEAQELVNSGEAEIPSEAIEKVEENKEEPKQEETPAQRKKREKAERKAREAAEKAAKEQKAE